MRVKQADKRQCIRVVPDPSGAPQPRRNQRGERLVECAHRLRCAAAGLHADRHHAAFAEQSLTGHRAADMRFEPPHDMPAIPSPDQPALPVNKAGIQQLDQRGEMCVVTVMRRRGQQQQSITASRDHFSQSPTQRVVAIRAGAGTDAMMRLVDDRQIPTGTFKLLEHAFLLGEIQRREAKRDRVERIAAQLQPEPLRLQRSGVGDRRKSQPEALPELLVPLHQQWAGGRYDQHAMRAPPCDQFADDEPRLDRLAKANAIGEQQARPRQLQRTHERNELVWFDLNPSRLRKQQVLGPEHLFQQAGLLMQPPRGQRPRRVRPEISTQDLNAFSRVQDVPFQPAQIARGATQAQQLLRAELRDLDHVPGEPARSDPASRREFHGSTVGGGG